MVFACGEQRGVIDSHVTKARHVQRIVAGERVAVDDGIRHVRSLMMGSRVAAWALAMTTA